MKWIFFILVVAIILSLLFSFYLKAYKEKTCLGKTIEKYGIEAPMKNEKWDYFSNCYKGFKLF